MLTISGLQDKKELITSRVTEDNWNKIQLVRVIKLLGHMENTTTHCINITGWTGTIHYTKLRSLASVVATLHLLKQLH